MNSKSYSNRLNTVRHSPAGIALLYAAVAALWIVLSGFALTHTVADPLLQNRIELAKGFAFVAVTSVLLYLLLNHWHESHTLQTELTPPPRTTRLVLIFMALASLAPLIDFVIYEFQVPQIERVAYDNLTSIAQLKASQIENWLKERDGDAQGLAANSGFAKQVGLLMQQRHHDRALPKQILGELDSLRANHRFDSVLLLDTGGKLLSVKGVDVNISPYLLAKMHQSLVSGKIQFTDLYRDDAGNIYLDWIVPVITADRNGKHAAAAVVLRTMPGKFLYPLIQNWPTASKSGESYLVRRQGNSIQYLSRLRKHEDMPLALHESMDAPDFPADIAVHDNAPGVTSGKDINNILVLAAYRPVAGTDWHLVAKIDRAEVMMPLQTLLYWISLITSVAVILVMAAFLMLYRQQQRSHQLTLLASSAEALRESELRYRTLVGTIPDLVWLKDKDGVYLNCNSQFEKLYGASQADLVGRSDYDFVDKEQADSFRKHDLKAMADDNSTTNEEWLTFAENGYRGLFETIKTPMKDANGNTIGVLGIARDISKRKLAEESLLKLSQAVEQSPSSIIITDLKGNIEYANAAFARESGYSLEEAIGSNPRLLHSGKTPKSTYDDMWAHLANGKPWEGEFINRRKDGSEYFELALISPVFQPDGRMTHFLAVQENITERKAAEAKIKRQTQLYAALSQCNQAIVRCSSEQELFQEICRIAVQYGGMNMTWIGLVDETSKQVRQVACYGTGVDYLDDIQISIDAGDPFGRGPTGTAIRENRPYWNQDFQLDVNTAPWHERRKIHDWKSSASLPLLRNGIPIGNITLYSGTVDAFDEDARRLLTEMAVDISFALDNFAHEAERMEAENNLKINEAMLTEMSKLAKVGGWEFDPETGQGFWTPEVARIHDMDPEEKTSLETGMKFYLGESRNKIEAAIAAAIADGTPYDLELEMETAKGNHKWVRTMGQPYMEDGKVVLVRGSFQDITQRKQAEEEIIFKNTILQTQQRASLDALLMVDENENIISYNQQFITLFGLSPQLVSAGLDEPVLQSVVAQVENPEEFLNRIRYLFKHREAKSREEILLKDGRIIDRYSAPITGTDGHYFGRVWYFRDITESRKALQELADSEQRFRGLVEQSLAGIYIIQDGRFVYVNPRAAEILGLDATDDLIGCDPLSFVAETDCNKVAEAMRILFAREQNTIALEFAALFKDGSEIIVGANASFASYHGEPAIIGLIQDISEKRHAEERIQNYVTQLKTTFLSTVQLATSLSEMRDPYTAGHERRVSEIAVAIASELGLDDQRIEGIKVAGYLHDIGKISIPAEILVKPGRLTATEYALVQGHAQASHEVLKHVEFPWPVATIALQHHERIDGSGYPNGLKGDEMLLESRIMAVADVVEAMASHRPYRPGLGIDRALAELERGRGSVYDPDIVDICLRLFREQKFVLPPY